MASKNRRQRLVFSEKLMYSFINDYRESGCLWDTKNPDYKCAEKRRAAFSRLSAKYDITEEEAKKKLNSLRSTYLQEKKKVEESKKIGGDLYVPSLYWYNELEFLYDVIIPRKAPHPGATAAYNCPQSPGTQNPDNCQSTAELINQEVDQEHLIFELVPDGNEKTIFTPKRESTFVTQSDCYGTIKKRRTLKKPAVLPQQHFSENVEIPPKCIQSYDGSSQSPQSSSLVQQEDEFDTFCCSIASQLRTLPPADAIEMQLEIQQLVSKRRLSVLKNQQNLSILRSWGNTESYHQYPTQTAMGNGDDPEEGNEKLILSS